MTPKQIKNRRAKVKAELDKTNFCGWGGETEFLSYDWKRFQNFCSGQIIIAIGANNFSSTVHNVLNWAMAWGQYQTEKRRLETKYGLDKVPSY